MAIQPSQWVPTAVGRLAVYDSGLPAGKAALPTVVLWPSVYADSSLYEPLAQRWQGRVRLVRIDGPGHGASGPGPAGGFSMQACAQALHQVMQALGIAQATVGGTSWGGLVGGEFALAYPQATQAVVMLNTPVFSEPGMADKLIVLGTRVMGDTGFFARQVAKGFFLDETLDAAGQQVQAFLAHLKRKPKQELADAVKAVLVDREDLSQRLAGIKVPVLFLTGQHDSMYSPVRLEAAAKQMPKVRLVQVNSRHISVVDQPELVAKAIEQLINVP